LDLSSSATAAILRGAPLRGESKRTVFAFFKLRCRKHTDNLADDFTQFLVMYLSGSDKLGLF